MPTYDSALKRVLGEIERAQASVCPTCNRPSILDQPWTDTAEQARGIRSGVLLVWNVLIANLPLRLFTPRSLITKRSTHVLSVQAHHSGIRYRTSVIHLCSE